MEETRWERATAPILLGASVAFLVAYTWRVITQAIGPEAEFANIVIIAAWALFAIDYVVRLLQAKHRWFWFRTHLPDLAITIIPVLRLVRLTRVFTRRMSARRSHAAALRTRIMVYGAGTAALLIVIASLQVLDAERDAEGATIVSFGDALWWACVTATTTGFGDLTPVTVIGRVVGVILMFGGVALAGVITATLASWVVERGAGPDDSEEAATKADVRALRDEIAALRAALIHPGEEPPGSPPVQ